MFSVDLKDVHFQIPVHLELRPTFLALKGTVYYFSALCIDLLMVPQIFTKVFTLVLTWAHQPGTCVLSYLTYWLAIADSLLQLIK